MKKEVLKISALALSAALVSVFTLVVRIPTPTTGGYISLCDASIVFVSAAFGPFTGFFASALGTAFADLIGGYPQWALISFAVHGIEGLIIGLLIRGVEEKRIRKALSLLVSPIVVPLGYFLLTGVFLESFATSAVEIIPNFIQGVAGSVTGALLYVAVSSSYRGLDNLRLSLKHN